MILNLLTVVFSLNLKSVVLLLNFRLLLRSISRTCVRSEVSLGSVLPKSVLQNRFLAFLPESSAFQLEQFSSLRWSEMKFNWGAYSPNPLSRYAPKVGSRCSELCILSTKTPVFPDKRCRFCILSTKSAVFPDKSYCLLSTKSVFQKLFRSFVF